ncbi:LRR receptor-like serine/threonine-protein kinase GSO1 [Iris pallida]|uniref:non-specific serine/threonine protein kinase n=1 Tax=Iris pallida TaxID=29817 RepID=A0AAX6GMU3_IRIPA|nr:LRR receptor-like serine/threonine-protein kinase GSO1 [Iris pallida]
MTGTIPPEIANLSGLVDLQLYNNSFGGRLPEGIARLKNLQYFSVAFNMLTGEVPSVLGESTSNGLIKVDLTGNDFYGPIPAGVCKGNRLAVLVISRNRFNGTFPSQTSTCPSLWRLDISRNRLRGVIPGNLSLNPGISYLDLSRNLFEGRIPAFLGFWRNLTMLDLSHNSFSGPIPPEFGSLHNLTKLMASSNRLTGAIPAELANCKMLLKLDLRSNSLSGSIPKEVVGLEKLQDLLISGNKLTGAVPDSFASSQSLLELQMGDNMLEGPIPYSLGNLQYISVALNLSNNRLTGEIPASLSKLDKLQILDLSNNTLSGQIPSGLGSMISLSFVTVSFNELTGKLPSNWIKFVDTLPGSFLGNPGLILHEEVVEKQSKKAGWLVPTIVPVFCVISLVVGGLCAAKYLSVAKARRLSALPRISTRGNDSTGGLPEDLTYEDILRVTEDLSEKYVIGRGRHGTVYRTEFDKGKCWAAKKLDLSNSSFFHEMNILNVVRHRNLLRMAGYCIREGVGIIICEYMPEGTLFEVLHERRPQIALDWDVRHRIALGVAQGLSYLHHDCVPQIIHRDVKSSNILMNSDLEPKIGDFGLAKMVDSPDERTTMSTIVGTLGYIAPENGYSTKLDEKCDVYSYGVVLLELLCRKMPVDPSFEDGVDIVTWIRSRVTKPDWGTIFDSLDEEIRYWEKEDTDKALELLDLAISCTQLACDGRPSMREVVGTLERMKSKSIRPVK